MRHFLLGLLLVISFFPELEARAGSIATGNVIEEILLLLEREQVDADHLSPRELLEGALNRVETDFPEVSSTLSYQTGLVILDLKIGGKVFHFGGSPPATLSGLRALLTGIHTFLLETITPRLESDAVLLTLMNGMLERIDPWGRLLDGRDYAQFRSNLSGRFSGLGLNLEQRNGRTIVRSVLAGSPAARSGINPGDALIHIDQTPATNLTLATTYRLLKGEAGTSVILRLKRAGKKKLLRLKLIRKELQLHSVASHLFEEGADTWLGYLRIAEFQHTTSAELVSHLNRLHPDAPGFLGLILDLRGNPGGLVEEAVRVADKFLNRGEIVILLRGQGEREIIRARGYGNMTEFPMVVLVDENSASGAEIVAAALQKNRRALLMGSPTVGKGSVQTVIPISGGFALKLTMARYLTPGGHSIQSVGVTPEIRLIPVEVSHLGGGLGLFPPQSNIASGKGADFGGYDSIDQLERSPLAKLQFLSQGTAFAPTGDFIQAHKPERELLNDFAINMAKQVLFINNRRDFKSLLRNSLDVLRSEGHRQNKKIRRELARLGVDWSKGRSPKEGRAEIQRILVHTRNKAGQSWQVPKGGVISGQEVRITLLVKNTGNKTLFQLIGRVRSEAPYFDRLEFPIGRLKPGGTGRWERILKMPENIPEGREHLSLELLDGEKRIHHRTSLFVSLKPKEPSVFSVDLEFLEDGSLGSRGNGNGILDGGETLAVKALITNLGSSPSGRGILAIWSKGDVPATNLPIESIFKPLSTGKSALVIPLLKMAFATKATAIPLTIQVVDEKDPDKILRRDFSLKLGGKLNNVHLEAPVIELDPFREIESTTLLTLTGQVRDDRIPRLVYFKVNGKKVFHLYQKSGGETQALPFHFTVHLREGRNLVEIEARDNDHLLSKKQMVIWRGNRVGIAGKAGFRPDGK